MPSPRSTDRQIVAVAVPAFFALVSEPLMLLADTAIVGHLGRSSLGGLSAASVVLSTVVGLCVFLAYGSTATVARRRGAGDTAGAYSYAVSGIWLAGGLGVVLGGALAASAGPLAQALSSSSAVADRAERYLVVSSLAVPALLVALAATGALRGVMDLRTPVVVTVVANLLNVVLNLALVHGVADRPGWGITGSAVGTVLAQWFGALWLTAVVVRGARRSGAPLRVRAGAVLRAGLDGVPLFVRTLALRAGLVLGTAVAAGLGDAPLAAQQVVTALVTFFAFALDAIAIAAQTLVGHALGAGDRTLARDLTRRMVGWGLGCGAVAAVVMAGLVPFAGSVFAPGDGAVADVLAPALLVAALVQVPAGVVYVLDGILIGAGDAVYLAWAGLLALVPYVPLALLVGHLGASFTWLWVAYGGYIAARLVTLWLRQRSDAWLVTGS
ncbi:MATE family efflux transporter [Aeromicrobium sp. Root495]|uniref:MATE family efflux transporter n=1 Tax=Aeromicrobium sp. Root495 TaxID=1736550 RepID=UPI0006FBC835|nr:MATE family efflux transporter [Aeromicrobium sp. Root495]KQY55957.1 MATE family efflux transporter [Aeromicrobium sp. Root495]